MEKLSFKGNYTIPAIKSKKDINTHVKDFIGVSSFLTDRTQKDNIVYTRKGILIKIIDYFDPHFEKIAKFYNTFSPFYHKNGLF